MKKLLCIICLACIAFGGYAQGGQKKLPPKVFVPKGQWIAGSSVSYSEHTENNYDFLVVEKINSDGYSFKLSPMFAYALKDNMALGGRFKYGRTLVRMDRILGRSDDMLIIRGVNVFPTQIESVILEMAEFEPHYLLIVGRENNTDTMDLQVEVRPDFYSDEINRMLALKKKLAGRLQSVLGLGVNVKLVEPRSIERSVGKAKRVIDNRKL